MGESRVWAQRSYGVAENSDRCSDQQLPINTFILKIHRGQEWESFVSAFKVVSVYCCGRRAVCNARELNAKTRLYD